MKVIVLKDGYNGHLAWFDATPIAVEGDIAKYAAIGIGKGWLFRLAHKDEVSKSPVIDVQYDAARDCYVRI